ncbi:DoxX family membrane protein [Umezawaea sp. Da 62-37]|uniref:DoxX family membrane protein n=1 Tax=Umezawaea sp. Da 62-37 TaxID=3075927 RepID=UPI0028F6E027|nr:DoxX family membrane protein [Umezawaea sp. Da 62-37]WNV84819.1 DoxX family membrane protein [Umezawaea sp. Da 62-37]
MSLKHQVKPTTEIPAPAPASTSTGKALAALRIAVGTLFLWAFLDKLFGFGYATQSGGAWINGGSPAKGFLGHVDVGPFQSLLRAMAGSTLVDALFMLGLAGVGIAVLLGVALRISAIAGTVMMALMWIAEWPLAQHTSAGAPSASTNPLIDYHVVYALALIVFAVALAGHTWGLGRRWADLKLVRANRWLL